MFHYLYLVKVGESQILNVSLMLKPCKSDLGEQKCLASSLRCTLDNLVLSFLTKKGTTASSYMLNQALSEGGRGGEDEDVVTVEMQPDEVIQTEGRKDKDDEFDWWSKFYASLDNSPLSQVEYEQAGFDTLVVRTCVQYVSYIQYVCVCVHVLCVCVCLLCFSCMWLWCVCVCVVWV